jgi:hypothetical protein
MKISELETDFLLNWGLNRNLIPAQGVLCKTVGFIWILICFYKGKTVDRVHGLWTGGAFDPPWTRGQSAAGARQRRGVLVFLCTGPHRGGVGSKRSG